MGASRGCRSEVITLAISCVCPRAASHVCIVDVHQVAIGNNGKLYMHGWQIRGCTKGRDYAAERIFRFDKIKSVKVIEGAFNVKSQSIKVEGWDGPRLAMV